MKIGMKAPAVRVPCINKGQIIFRSLADFHETPLALCCLSNITEKDAWFLESQAQEFEQSGSNLGVLVSSNQILGSGWVHPLGDFSFPLYIDPIRQLRTALHLSPSLQPTRGETLIFDQGKCLRFRLIHDLTLKGFSAVLDIIASDFLQDVTETRIASTKHDHEVFHPAGFNAVMGSTS